MTMTKTTLTNPLNMGIFQCHESWSANLLSKNGDFTSCHGSFLSGVKIFLTGKLPVAGGARAGLRCTAGPTARGSWRHSAGAALMYLSSLAFFGVFPGMMLVKL